MASKPQADSLFAAFALVDQKTDEMIQALIKVAAIQDQIIARTALVADLTEAVSTRTTRKGGDQ